MSVTIQGTPYVRNDWFHIDCRAAAALAHCWNGGTQTVNGQILYIGRDDTDAGQIQSALKAQGYELVCTSDAREAAELLRTRLLHAVCVDGRNWEESEGAAIGECLKFARPDAPVVVIHSRDGARAVDFEEHADVEIDNTTFLSSGHWMIEELRAARFPVFTQWLEEWKQRLAA